MNARRDKSPNARSADLPSPASRSTTDRRDTAIGRIVANAGGFAANNPRSFAFRIHPQRTLILMHILILGEGSVNQASCRVQITSQAIQWFTTSLGYKGVS